MAQQDPLDRIVRSLLHRTLELVVYTTKVGALHSPVKGHSWLHRSINFEVLEAVRWRWHHLLFFLG